MFRLRGEITAHVLDPLPLYLRAVGTRLIVWINVAVTATTRMWYVLQVKQDRT
jgi:hypothetical protein